MIRFCFRCLKAHIFHLKSKLSKVFKAVFFKRNILLIIVVNVSFLTIKRKAVQDNIFIDLISLQRCKIVSYLGLNEDRWENKCLEHTFRDNTLGGCQFYYYDYSK